ncbi:hypothetical protein ES703_113462 [subsurface metagenome]
MVMIKLNIHEAKTHLSRYLSKLADGEKIVLCKRNVPIAEIIPISPTVPKTRRPVGLAKGQFTIPEAFFEPLPDKIIKSFYSKES